MDGGGVVGASGGGHTHTHTDIHKNNKNTTASNELMKQTEATTTQTDVNVCLFISLHRFLLFIAVSDVTSGLEQTTSPNEFWENVTVKCTVCSTVSNWKNDDLKKKSCK